MSLKSNMAKYRKLYVKAAKGNMGALGELSALNDYLMKEANRNLAELRRKGFDYGAAYNNAMYYLESELDSKRFKSSRMLKHDPMDLLTQMEQMEKFMSYKSSTVQGQRDILERKKQALIQNEVVPKNMSDRTFKSFIKFLGNEETREIVDEYGDSDKVIEMVYDAFKSRKNTLAGMRRAFVEYLSRRHGRNKMGFDEMMERINIDVYSDKYL